MAKYNQPNNRENHENESPKAAKAQKTSKGSCALNSAVREDASPAPVQLSNLPNELIIRILAHLPVPDLGSCCSTCRVLNLAIQNSIFLQYRIALHKAGYEDNVNCPLSYAKKLEMLRRREEAWLTCTPDFQQVAPLSFDPGSAYDLSGDLYFLGDSSRKRLRYSPLPDTPSDIPEWKTFDSGDNRFIVDFALNVYEHDLIALITAQNKTGFGPFVSYSQIELSIRQLSTGKFHPQAQQPRIPIVVSDPDWRRPSVDMEIVGDYLALVTTFWSNPPTRCTVSVYEWKTGKLVLKVDSDSDRYSGLVFLSENILLLPNTVDRVLEIRKIPSSFEDPPSPPLRKLGLPRLSPHNALSYITCRGEPNPVGENSSFAHSRRPFHCNPLKSVVLLRLRVDNTLFAIFVHRKSLLALLNSSETVDTEQTIPWSDWAPSITFCVDIRGGVSSRWITTTCGQCFVILPVSETGEDDTGEEDGERCSPSPMMVFDFNPINVKKVKQELEKGPDDATRFVNDGRSVMVGGDMFLEEIISCLPCVVSTVKSKFEFDGVLMDESRLLGLKAC